MNKTILLLEDDPNLGLVVQEHLQMNGYEVTLCVNGEAGLVEFSKNTFALCLVDVMMPIMDGFAFAREVRRRDTDTPLIFLTAKSLKADKIEGFQIGCDDYITKPFSVEELLLRIRAVLLRLLCLHQDQTLERNLALREIWGDESYFNARSMDVFISKLRKHLKDDDHIEISSIHGIGFKLTVS